MAGELVLIVDDNATNARLAAFLLKSGGYAVDVAETGPEGIEKARSVMPALILMDIALPGMDGLAATRQLKKDPVTADIPVVALTANAMRGDQERCLQAGCSGYIAKPIDTKQFVRTVAAHLEGK